MFSNCTGGIIVITKCEGPNTKVWPAKQFSRSFGSTILTDIPSNVTFGMWLHKINKNFYQHEISIMVITHF